MLGAGELSVVASAGYTGVLRRRHRSIRRDFLPVHQASCKKTLQDIREHSGTFILRPFDHNVASLNVPSLRHCVIYRGKMKGREGRREREREKTLQHTHYRPLIFRSPAEPARAIIFNHYRSSLVISDNIPALIARRDALKGS